MPSKPSNTTRSASIAPSSQSQPGKANKWTVPRFSPLRRSGRPPAGYCHPLTLAITFGAYAIGAITGLAVHRGGPRLRHGWPVYLRIQLVATAGLLGLFSAWRLTAPHQIVAPIVMAAVGAVLLLASLPRPGPPKYRTVAAGGVDGLPQLDLLGTPGRRGPGRHAGQCGGRPDQRGIRHPHGRLHPPAAPGCADSTAPLDQLARPVHAGGRGGWSAAPPDRTGPCGIALGSGGGRTAPRLRGGRPLHRLGPPPPQLLGRPHAGREPTVAAPDRHPGDLPGRGRPGHELDGGGSHRRCSRRSGPRPSIPPSKQCCMAIGRAW